MQKRCRSDADQEVTLHRSLHRDLHRFRCRSSDADEVIICIASASILMQIHDAEHDADCTMQISDVFVTFLHRRTSDAEI